MAALNMDPFGRAIPNVAQEMTALGRSALYQSEHDIYVYIPKPLAEHPTGSFSRFPAQTR
jgi:hypothetical protein